MKIKALVLGASLTGALMMTGALFGQTSGGAYKVPRMADGHPDLQGTYDLATITPVERPRRQAAFLSKEEEYARLQAKWFRLRAIPPLCR